MAITRGQFRTRILRRADVENTTVQLAAEVNDHINDSIAALHLLLMKEYGTRYSLKSDTLVTAPNVAQYDLVAAGITDFERPVRVHVTIGTESIPLGSFSFESEIFSSQGGTFFGGEVLPGFIIGRDQLNAWQMQFNPPPDRVMTVTIFYHPNPPSYSADSQTLAFSQPELDWALLDTVIRIKDKQGRDTSGFERQLASAEKRIQQLAAPLDRATVVKPVVRTGPRFGGRRSVF